MVTAYLRGLLKPNLNFSLRSFLAESVILEAIDAEVYADTLSAHALGSLSFTESIAHNSKNAHIDAAFAKINRASELMTYDIYNLQRAKAANTISSHQLFQILEKNGIIEKLRQEGEACIEKYKRQYGIE